MQFEEACKEATLTALSNVNTIDKMLGQLEDFDGLTDNSLWGSIQSKLIALKKDYEQASLVLQDAITESENTEDTLDNIIGVLRNSISELLLSGHGHTISINVSPTIH